MKLTDGTEVSSTLMDQATIALMELSISHLELLEQLAAELQARTRSQAPLPGAHKELAGRLFAQRLTGPAGTQRAGEYQAGSNTEKTWDH